MKIVDYFKQDVTNLLHGEAEARSIRERLRQKQQQQKNIENDKNSVGVHRSKCTPAFSI